MSGDQQQLAQYGADPRPDASAAPEAPGPTAEEGEWEPRRHGGRTRYEWIEHVLRRAAERRRLAELEADLGNVASAQLLMRSALVRELHVASLRGEQSVEEARVAHELLATWTGASIEELLNISRAILAGQPEVP